MGTINSSDRMAATLYCLGTLFVSGIQGVIKNYRDLVSENYKLLLMAKNI
jgi:hypothetical protein